MRRVFWISFGLGVLVATVAAGATGAGAFPDWAFPPCPPSRPAAASADDVRTLSVAGSNRRFTAAELDDWSVTKDWFPEEHAALPPILAASRSPQRAACGYCHLPDGSGRPENAKLAGLPAIYIIAQVKALRTGERRPAQPGWTPAQLMRMATADVSDADLAAAANYFAQQKVQSFVRVVERATAPLPGSACFVFVPRVGKTVPLGQRLLEMPVDLERFERRDPHATYIAYVPPGGRRRGRLLARTGGDGRTQPCATCHGADLRGGLELPGPPLAGRFPGYLFRQLYGFQTGARGNSAAAAMRAVVAPLTQAELIDLAAYAASLPP